MSDKVTVILESSEPYSKAHVKDLEAQCTGCGVQQGASLGSACSGGCGWNNSCVLSQGQNLIQGLGQGGLEREGLTGYGPNVGGVTPQNERMQEIPRLKNGSGPM